MRRTMIALAAIAGLAAPLRGQEVIQLVGEDRLLGAEFDEVYRLGSLDGGGWDMFGSVAGLGFDGVGHLYILDTQAMRVSVVEP